jgi:FkbM family methyltransferase
MFGRSLSRVSGALFNYKNYLSILKAPVVYANPLKDFIEGYILQKGAYPRKVNLKTPTGIQSIELKNSLDTFTVNEIFAWEIYLVDSQKSKVIVDFGSNIGVSEVYFLSRHPQNIVYGFEPVPHLYEQLQKNTDAFRSRALNQNIALSNETGNAQMGVESSGRYGGIGVKTESEITINTINVNSALSEILANHQFIDVLKIDIEGMEDVVLNSISEDILAKIKLIYLEAGDDDKFFPQNLKKFFKLVSHRGICKYENIL